jgi:hypothetical protein
MVFKIIGIVCLIIVLCAGMILLALAVLYGPCLSLQVQCL